ncbi:PEP/pyruvate-binding domain-containing protein [Methanomethylovorans sp.]|uniref:PEP/pyruvate-binding domain-containing protein n=1 Tax=Methanomethylovorans sp. TaxID=2758717 RepID=UPI003D11A8B0
MSIFHGESIVNQKINVELKTLKYADKEKITSGVPQLDEILHSFRLGDNVVWEVEGLEDYRYFAVRLIRQAISSGSKCVYVRFAPHEPILQTMEGLDIVKVDPSNGFDFFSSQVHRIIEYYGEKVYYVFDNLSSLMVEWATDELVANFFKATCPYLFELETIGYFCLTRGKHSHSTVAGIRETTQVLIDYYHINGKAYIHPLKVYARYSQSMFLPHLVTGEAWEPILDSSKAATISSSDRRKIIRMRKSGTAPWDTVYTKLKFHHDMEILDTIPKPEITALKQELSRMIIGDHPRFNRLADTYLGLEDLLSIRDRMIGSGRIGGKAVGMLLSRNIILASEKKEEFSGIIEPHDSFYVGSDVFFTFMINNDLFRLKIKLSDSSSMTKEEFEEVEKKFLEGKFPEEIVEQFRELMDYFGQAPIIVRSSSLQEDNYGNAFAGKYRSEFCPNQGSPDERLEEFMHAVKIVYASALNPDALAYRRTRGLHYQDEQMAILVQRVSGMPYKQYFFPALAGVAFSKNLFQWTKRIDPRKGLIRLVFGLGTRAVDRVGRDYPRMIAVSHPTLRPETGMKVMKYSQWDVDALDLDARKLITIPFQNLAKDCDYPGLRLFVSVMNEGYLTDPYTNAIDCSQEMVLTFNNLIKNTKFVDTMGEILRIVEEVYEHPVDIEFTAAVDQKGNIRINIVQCRPMTTPGRSENIAIPDDIKEDNILFRSSMLINEGKVENVEYIVYIDPQAYEIADMDTKRSIGRIVGSINEKMSSMGTNFILMGPGRWGSSNIELGVNATYSEIDHTSLLVEIALEKAGHTPEVSYGTHFFQDIVEEEIIYMPVYPDMKSSGFNNAFFSNSGNVLKDILPDHERFSNVIKVINVREASGGRHAVVIANLYEQDAICYLEKPTTGRTWKLDKLKGQWQ